jgi:hypothetical protein
MRMRAVSSFVQGAPRRIRSRLASFSAADMLSMPRATAAPTNPDPLGRYIPFEVFLNSTNGSTMLTGTSQPSARKHPTSALA